MRSRKKVRKNGLPPPHIIKALGEFDLDPCAPIHRQWDTAKNHYTILDSGLYKKWEGRVWLNPPYGNEAQKWMRRMASHGNGIAFLFARTETKMFFDSVWGRANAVLFMKGRINFYHNTGKESSAAPSPSVLIAYGENNAECLKSSLLEGYFIRL